MKSARSLFTSIAFFLLISFASAQSPQWLWAKSMGNNYSNRCLSVALDKSSNVYATGTFNGVVDFDPNSGVFNMLTNTNNANVAYVTKLDSNGNFRWARAFSNSYYSSDGYYIGVDSSGYVYTIGNFQGIIDLDPGVDSFNLSSSDGNIFISKLDSAGNFVWGKQIGSGVGVSYSLAFDAANNLYISGQFRGICDFDPGPGVYNLTSSGTTYSDIFVCKIDSSGNLHWAESIGGTSEAITYAICSDAEGYIYLTGSFMGTVDFNPSVGVDTLSTTGRGIFVCKLDSAGGFIWTKGMIGGAGEGRSISSDAKGNIYFTGSFYKTVDFDPGPGVYNLSPPTSSDFDFFISKLDSAGNLIVVKNIGGVNNEISYALKLDNGNNVLVAGFFNGIVAFNPDSANHVLTSSYYGSLFVLKLDSLLNFEWVKSSDGLASSVINSIAIDNLGNSYLGGRFSMPASLVFGVDTVINPDGNTDILLLKLDHTIVNQVDSNIVDQFSTFYAGQDTGRHVMYYDFVPDTVIVMQEVNGDWHIQDGNLNLDLNHDGINDFNLKEYFTISPGHTYENYYINCFNGNQVVTLTDTSGGVYAYPLSYGIQIDSCTSWSTNDSVVLGGSFTLNIGGQTHYWGPWNLVVDKYLGVRIIDSTDSIYGYIHINRMNGFKILDYGIYGRHIGGDDVVETFPDAFFPNPFHSSATLIISPTFENSNYKIYNAVGAFIREGKITNQKSFVLNRNGLANGFYFLQLTNESGQQLTKKFEVE